MAAAMKKLFNDITEESRSAAPSAHFSVSVRARLEKYKKKVRRDIVTRIKHKSAPLFHACAHGKLEMVEYLISTCGADPEQKGWHGESEEMVPPLWCATVLRKLPVVECLIGHRCQVDALSDGQMTALEAACFKGPAKLDIVEYLLQHGAKVDRRFHYGRTCLMQAVRNAKLCRILLRYGADVNITDMDGKTALHHAVELRKLDSVKLLLENKADPHMRTKRGDDALQAAVLYGDEGTVLALTKHTSYPPERLANMYELWGSRLYLENRNQRMTLIRWREAVEIRNSNMMDGNPMAKKTPEENVDDDAMEKRLCYGNAFEFTSLAELDAFTGNWQAIWIQCMLIRERILGKRHELMLSSIMRTASFFIHNYSLRSVSLSQKIHLWIRALEIWNAGSTRSLKTACDIAADMIALDCKFRVDGNRGRETEEFRFVDVVSIFKSLTSIFSMAWTAQKNPLLEWKYRNEYRNCYVKMALFITTAIYWFIKTAKTSEEKYEAREHVRCLIEVDPKSIPENYTLLHISVFASEWIKVLDPEWEKQFLQVIELMLECGARVNARNADGVTPLHFACCADFTDSLNKLLVEHGAHLDTPTCCGFTPARMIPLHPSNTIDVQSYMTLQCYAARAIVRHEVPCNNLPPSLQEFVDLHRCKKEVEEFRYSDEHL